ncbi:MAG: 3-keto-L-gulonate-6-phosphate decarboxylase UlaD [Spirochaetes bacterium]|nr:3-keto-L-gulonate-6-phosphate decarboxylase UlaD [Spirochaetota bacterium]
MNLPKLQIALDTFDLPSALSPLQKAHQSIDVIEVGTVLCLSEGMHAVRIIRSLYPDKIILADVRIAEAGSIISKMAFEAGADWVSVVSGASMTTAEVVFKEAQKWKRDVQIELSEGWTWEKAKQWRDIGIEQAIIHRSRDKEVSGELSWGEADFENICKLADMGYKVTVTGGVNLEDIKCFQGIPVYIFIVGRGIRSAADPSISASQFQNEIKKIFS